MALSDSLNFTESSVLGPILFTIATNSITSVVKPQIRTALFAGDLVIFISCKNTAIVELALQLKWSEDHGLQFSDYETKSQFIVLLTIVAIHGTVIIIVLQDKIQMFGVCYRNFYSKYTTVKQFILRPF